MAATNPDILTMFKCRTDEEKFLNGFSLITQEKSLPEASVRHALTFHRPEPGHLPSYKPMAGKREWFRSITIVPPGTGDRASLPSVHCHLLCAGTKWTFAQPGRRENDSLSAAGPSISFYMWSLNNVTPKSQRSTARTDHRRDHRKSSNLGPTIRPRELLF